MCVRGDRDASDSSASSSTPTAIAFAGERRIGTIRSRGRVHDLESSWSDVNYRYFDSALSDVLVTWGQRTQPARGQARQSIKLGSYSATERLIRVHPVLDRDWVPRYFVAYIVYHELLHHLVPPVRVGGPRRVAFAGVPPPRARVLALRARARVGAQAHPPAAALEVGAESGGGCGAGSGCGSGGRMRIRERARVGERAAGRGADPGAGSGQ